MLYIKDNVVFHTDLISKRVIDNRLYIACSNAGYDCFNEMILRMQKDDMGPIRNASECEGTIVIVEPGERCKALFTMENGALVLMTLELDTYTEYELTDIIHNNHQLYPAYIDMCESLDDWCKFLRRSDTRDWGYIDKELDYVQC